MLYLLKQRQNGESGMKITQITRIVIATFLLVALLMADFTSNTSITVFAASKPLEEDIYYIVSALDEKKALDIKNASTSNGANVQLYKLNNSAAQRFKLTYKNGYYTITNANSNKALDVQGGGTSNGTNVQQYKSNNSNAQKWKIKDLGNGYFSIQAKCGLYLDVKGGNTANKTNIQIYKGNKTKSQMFKFIPYVKYTYKTVTLDCSSVSNWQKSLMSYKNAFGSNMVVSYEVISSKKITDTIYIGSDSLFGYKGGTKKSQKVKVSLPHKVKFKLHTHTLNKGFGHSWYYTNNGIQMVETCNCGYRKENLFWEIPG